MTTTTRDAYKAPIHVDNRIAKDEHGQHVYLFTHSSLPVDFSEISGEFVNHPGFGARKGYSLWNSLAKFHDPEGQDSSSAGMASHLSDSRSFVQQFAEEQLWSLPSPGFAYSREEDSALSLYRDISRHREYDALGDEYAQRLLWDASGSTYISADDVIEFARDYAGLRAVVRVALAGWVVAGPEGLLITSRGRRRAKRLFKDR